MEESPKKRKEEHYFRQNKKSNSITKSLDYEASMKPNISLTN